MTEFQYGINGKVNLCAAGGLGKGFDGDVDEITLRIDGGIELDFLDIYFEGCNDGKVNGLTKGVQYGINYSVGWYIYGWLGTGFYGYADVITLGIDKLIKIGFLDRSFNMCSYGKL